MSVRIAALLLWVALWGQDVRLPPPSGDEARATTALTALRRRRGRPHCQEDRRLTAAARETSRALLQVEGRSADTAWTTFAARQIGITDPTLHCFAVRYQELSQGLEHLLAAHHATDPTVTDCGIGVAASSALRVLTLISVRRVADLEAFPVQPAPGERAVLKGRLRSGYARARVLVTRPHGGVERLPLMPAMRGFAAEIDFDERGEHQIEVMADGPEGPVPVSLLSAYVGVAPPRHPTLVLEPSTPEDAVTAASRLHELLRAARGRAGLLPLQPMPLLARLAQEHAVDMRQDRFFGHVSPTRGNLSQRMTHMGIWSPRVAENVARAPSAARIAANVMASPAHRANVLDPLLTHVGIGVAQVSPGDLLGVMVFARSPGMR